MSTIRERDRSDGTTAYQVVWRDRGKQRWRSLNSGRAAAEYRRILDLAGEEAAERHLSRGIDRQTWTVDAWVEHSIANRPRAHKGTKDEYRRMWARTLGPMIGPLPLDLLDRDHVAQAVTELADRLSSKSVKNARDLLASALAEAKDRRLIEDVATRGVGIPRVRADHAGQMRTLTHAEWYSVLAQVDPFWVPCLVMLGVTGMRVNEMSALQVQDLDLEHRTVRIVRAWKRGKDDDGDRGWFLGPPKTKRSVRTIHLDAAVIDLLAHQVGGKLPTQLIFTSRDGNRVHDGNLRSRVWQPACERAGIAMRGKDGKWIVRPPRIHDIRHTAASWWIAQGVQLPAIQARLGHESIKTTVDTYGHLQADTLRAAAEVAALALPPGLLQIGPGD